MPGAAARSPAARRAAATAAMSRTAGRGRRAELVRRAGRIDRNAGHDAGADELLPARRAFSSRPAEACQRAAAADRSHRARAAAAAPLGVLAQPVDLCRLADRLPHLPRRLADRRPAPAWSRPATAATRARPARRRPVRTTPPPPVVVAVPVVDEPDVLHVLPFIGLIAQTLFEQRDRQIRRARRRLGYGSARKTAPNR